MVGTILTAFPQLPATGFTFVKGGRQLYEQSPEHGDGTKTNLITAEVNC